MLRFYYAAGGSGGVLNGAPNVNPMEVATGGGGATIPTVIEVDPWMLSLVTPSGSVAVAVSVSVAVPDPTAVMMAPFGTLGSDATVKTVGSDEAYVAAESVASDGPPAAVTGVPMTATD
jgi:hypothetical protein